MFPHGVKRLVAFFFPVALLMGLQDGGAAATDEGRPSVAAYKAATEEHQSIPVQAAIIGNADSATLFYRVAGPRSTECEGSYDSAEMTLDEEEDIATGSVPPEYVTIRGVEFYVEAYLDGVPHWGEDANGDLIDCANPIRAKISVREKSPPTPLPAGEHRIISVPVQPFAETPERVFGLRALDRADWRLGQYSAEADSVLEYDATFNEPIVPGQGYWLITRNEFTPKVNGESVLTERGESTFPIELAGPQAGAAVGWTQIGAPFAYDVLWSDCTVTAGENVWSVAAAADNGLLDNGAYAFTGAAADSSDGDPNGYEASPRLEPWVGYFVGAKVRGLTLLVPAREAPEPLAKLADDPGAWRLGVRLEEGGVWTSGVTLGVRDDARAGWDAHDRLRPPPPVERRNAAGVSIRGSEGLQNADYRPPTEGLLVWDLVVSVTQETEVVLRCIPFREIPEGFGAVLVDEAGGAVRRADPSMEHRYASRPGETERTIQIVFGPVELLESGGFQPAERPISFALDQPHPNPFRQGAFLRYEIPAAGQVKLSVYDARGRLVRRLVNGLQPAGEHVSQWRDARAASGVYFIRLEYGARSLTRRALRIR